MTVEYLAIAFKSLIHRKVRSWLTLLGIFIGIAAIVSLISLGGGLRVAILSQLSFIGGDLIIISPGGLAGPPGTESGSSKLFNADFRVVDRLPEVGLASSFLTRTFRVGYEDEETSMLVFGLPTDKDQSELFDQLSAFDVVEGRKLRSGDKFKAVLAWGTAHQGVFEKEIPLGKRVTIEGQSYEVVGVRKKIGNPILDNQAVITLDHMRDITGLDEEISGIRARPKDGVSVVAAEEKIKRALRRHRGVDEGEEDFSAQTSQQVLDSIGTILLIVQVVIGGIAAISLLVGGVGITNTMFTSVLERTKEIGIMKAIGAKNSDVLFMFLFESGLLGVVGGIVGVLAGVAFGFFVEFVGGLAFGSNLIQAEFTFSLIAGALLFSFVVGSIAGIIPAVQASRSNPVEALRYE